MIRRAEGPTVRRICEITGIPERTFYRQVRRDRDGQPARGPWPAPVRDRLDEPAALLALSWGAWGHRKIWAMLNGAGETASQSTRPQSARGSRSAAAGRYHQVRRDIAKVRPAVFVDPPTRRNAVWQTDFTQIETAGGGTWRAMAVVDYWAKVCLVAPISMTLGARDAVAAPDAAAAAAERRQGHSMSTELTDPVTGELALLTIATDNGSAYRAAALARWFAARPWAQHVRTKVRSPQTNGVVERFNGSVKYEHLYRDLPADGPALQTAINAYIDVYNDVRPHETIGFSTPTARDAIANEANLRTTDYLPTL